MIQTTAKWILRKALGIPENVLPLNVIEHGDADVDLMWRNALARVGPDNRKPEPAVALANRKALAQIMPEQEWRALERHALELDI